MDYSEKIKYILDFGESAIPKSEKFKVVTSTQITEKLQEMLPDGCKVSVKSVLAWKYGQRNPSYANRQAIDQLVTEIMEKRLFKK